MTNQFAIAPLDKMNVQLAKYRDTFFNAEFVFIYKNNDLITKHFHTTKWRSLDIREKTLQKQLYTYEK